MDTAKEMRRLIDLLTDEVSDKPITTAIDHVEMAANLNSELVGALKKRLLLQQNKINKAALRKKSPPKTPPPPKSKKVVKSGDKPSSVTTDAPSLPTGNRPTSNSYSAGSSFGAQPVAPSSPPTSTGTPTTFGQ